MSAPSGKIANVSDTALWVAYYRHMESERPDAIFHDPYAKRLSGAKGEAIVNAMPRGRQMAWAMIVRTKVFDEVVLDVIEKEKVDLVINLAAGLDARPWRLDLPPSLRWVDVDFPDMVEYKTSRLADEKPRCRYEAVSTDLSDASTRPAVFARIAAGATRTLVLAEGLLIYLAPEQVASLARDLAAMPSARWWLIDLASPRLLHWMKKSWAKRGSMGTAEFQFAPEENTAFFAPHGWVEDRFISSGDAAKRLKRGMRFMWFWMLIGKLYPKRVQEKFKRFSGYALLRRS
jgi:methyltransferase (TIGR00027 family)